MKHETHISAKQAPPQKNDRLSSENENRIRAQYHQQKKKKRAQETRSLKGDQTFPRSCRLLTRRDFARVRSGKRFVGRSLLVYVRPSASKKLGISASARYGSSPERNRFKRLVREAFRKSYSNLPMVEINVIPRSYAKQATTQQIFEELNQLITHEAQ